MSTEITREKWLKALNEAQALPLPEMNEPNVMTRAELCELLGLRETAVHRRMLRLITQGKAERTTKVVVDAMGRVQRLPAYRLKEVK